MTGLVWAALAILVTQAVILIALLRCTRSFGAFTNALVRTHDENVLVHQHNINLTEENARTSRRIKHVADVLSDRSFGLPSPVDKERSA